MIYPRQDLFSDGGVSMDEDEVMTSEIQELREYQDSLKKDEK